MTIEIRKIGPDEAKEILKSNTHNRPVTQSRVKQHAQQMLKGNWTIGSDMIVISEDRVLLNGQHRLLGVIESGCTVEFVVRDDAEGNEFEVMDIGNPRSSGDILSLQGHPVGNALAAAATVCMKASGHRGVAKNGNASKSEIIEYVRLNPELPDIAHQVSLLHKTRFLKALRGSASNMAAVAYLANLACGDKAAVMRFAGEYYQQSPTGDDIAITTLRKKLEDVDLTSRDGRALQVYLLSRGWLAWSQSTPAKEIRIVGGWDAKPFEYPTKIRRSI